MSYPKRVAATATEVVGDVDSVNGAIGDVVITAASLGLGNVDNTTDVNKPVSTATQTALDLKANLALLAVSNGIATLDSNGQLITTQIPSALMSGLKWKGVVDVPGTTFEAASSANSGYFYKNNTTGTSSVTGETISWAIGDWLISNGTAWQRVAAIGSVMGAATSSATGAQGEVPTPAAGKNTAFLRGDATWSGLQESATNTLSSAASAALKLNSTSGAGTLQVAGISYYNWSSTEFSPVTASTYTNGTLALPWSNTYTNAVTSAASTALTLNATATQGNLSVAGTNYYQWTASSFSPATTATYSLGTSSLVWATVNTNNVKSAASTSLTLNSATTPGYLAVAGTPYFQWTTTAISPYATNAYNLGTASLVYSNIYTNNVRSSSGTGLGLGVNGTVYLTINTAGNTLLEGGIRPGTDAPVIKMKYLTGTMAAVGSTVNVTHGLTYANIIGMQVLVSSTAGYLTPPGYRFGASDVTALYDVRIGSTTVDLITGASATTIAGQTARILITYTA